MDETIHLIHVQGMFNITSLIREILNIEQHIQDYRENTTPGQKPDCQVFLSRIGFLDHFISNGNKQIRRMKN
jgi:hypothetical protein